jgi:hypothetical protein
MAALLLLPRKQEAQLRLPFFWFEHFSRDSTGFFGLLNPEIACLSFDNLSSVYESNSSRNFPRFFS